MTVPYSEMEIQKGFAYNYVPWHVINFIRFTKDRRKMKVDVYTYSWLIFFVFVFCFLILFHTYFFGYAIIIFKHI